MKTILLFFCVAFFISGCSTTVNAFPTRDRRVVVIDKHKRVKPRTVIVVGTRIKKKPIKSIVIYYKDVPYLYSDGVFYKSVGNEYEVIKPQIGMIVPELPEEGIGKIVIKNEILYSYDNVLYKEIPTAEGIKYEIYGFINE